MYALYAARVSALHGDFLRFVRKTHSVFGCSEHVESVFHDFDRHDFVAVREIYRLVRRFRNVKFVKRRAFDHALFRENQRLADGEVFRRENLYGVFFRKRVLVKFRKAYALVAVFLFGQVVDFDFEDIAKV